MTTPSSPASTQLKASVKAHPPRSPKKTIKNLALASRRIRVMVSCQIHTAVEDNNVAAVKAVLLSNNEADADINVEDEHGVTALIKACISGNAEIVRLLLDAGCPAQPTAPFRHTPLRGAAVCGNARLVPLLLRSGADPNAASEGRRTPLMGACFLRGGVDGGKSAACVAALLEDGRTDPTVRNSFGEAALDLARARGYTESIALVERALSEWGERHA